MDRMFRHRIMTFGLLFALIFLVGCQGNVKTEDPGEIQIPAAMPDGDKNNPVEYFSLGQELGEYQSWDLELGDLNEDGYLDLFIASLGQDDPKIWFNDGSGNFSPADQQIPGCARGVLGDVNGDGRLDLIIAEWNSHKPVWTDMLSVWLHGDDGVFNLQDRLPVPEETQTMILGDFNADRTLDLFVLGAGENQVWMNDGMGNFELSNQDLQTGIDSAAGAGDLDGDNDVDILSGGWEGPPAVWLNDGTGHFSRHGISITEGDLHIHGMALGDLDWDGDLDAFVTLANGAPHQVWINDGGGGFSISQTLPAPLGHAVALGDMDGDGDVDAVTGHGYSPDGHIRLWLNDGKGKFMDSSLVLGDHFTGAVVVGDLDLDLDLDIISAQSLWNEDIGPPDLIWLNGN